MTPAINTAETAGVTHRVHQHEHEAGAVAYGVEAAEKMGVDPARVFKTLVVSLGEKSFGVRTLTGGTFAPLCQMGA